MLREVLPILLATLLLIGLALVLSPRKKGAEENGVLLLDENLNVLARIPAGATVPTVYGNRVLLGKVDKGFVFVPRECLRKVRFLDRFLFLAGVKAEAALPIRWWLERNGVRIEPEGDITCSGFDVVAQTPYEIIRSEDAVVPVYEPVYPGEEYNVPRGCVALKSSGKTVVPVALPPGGLADPGARVSCEECGQRVKVRVVDEDGRPLSGFFSVGDGLKYYFFGRFDGEFSACKCAFVKVYASGMEPFAGTVCSDRNVVLRPLKNRVHLKPGFIYLDVTGALVSFKEAFEAPPGAYKEFVPLPLHEKGAGLPIVATSRPVWLGYRERSLVPAGSVVRVGDKYAYVDENGDISPLTRHLCRDGVCLEVGDSPLAAFGLCEVEWRGELEANCPTLGVNPYKRRST